MGTAVQQRPLAPFGSLLSGAAGGDTCKADEADAHSSSTSSGNSSTTTATTSSSSSRSSRPCHSSLSHQLPQSIVSDATLGASGVIAASSSPESSASTAAAVSQGAALQQCVVRSLRAPASLAVSSVSEEEVQPQDMKDPKTETACSIGGSSSTSGCKANPAGPQSRTEHHSAAEPAPQQGGNSEPETCLQQEQQQQQQQDKTAKQHDELSAGASALSHPAAGGTVLSSTGHEAAADSIATSKVASQHDRSSAGDPSSAGGWSSSIPPAAIPAAPQGFSKDPVVVSVPSAAASAQSSDSLAQHVAVGDISGESGTSSTDIKCGGGSSNSIPGRSFAGALPRAPSPQMQQHHQQVDSSCRMAKGSMSSDAVASSKPPALLIPRVPPRQRAAPAADSSSQPQVFAARTQCGQMRPTAVQQQQHALPSKAEHKKQQQQQDPSRGRRSLCDARAFNAVQQASMQPLLPRPQSLRRDAMHAAAAAPPPPKRPSDAGLSTAAVAAAAAASSVVAPGGSVMTAAVGVHPSSCLSPLTWHQANLGSSRGEFYHALVRETACAQHTVFGTAV